MTGLLTFLLIVVRARDFYHNQCSVFPVLCLLFGSYNVRVRLIAVLIGCVMSTFYVIERIVPSLLKWLRRFAMLVGTLSLSTLLTVIIVYAPRMLHILKETLLLTLQLSHVVSHTPETHIIYLFASLFLLLFSVYLWTKGVLNRSHV